VHDVVKLVVFDAEVEADVLVIDTHVIADALVPGKVLVDVDVVELVVLEGLLLRRCHSAPNLLAVSPPGGVHGEELLLRRRRSAPNPLAVSPSRGCP